MDQDHHIIQVTDGQPSVEEHHVIEENGVEEPVIVNVLVEKECIRNTR